MIQIFYLIFNDNDELLFAQNIQHNAKEEAEKYITDLYNEVIKEHNIKIIEHTSNILKFIDIPKTELEGEETHIFQIIE